MPGRGIRFAWARATMETIDGREKNSKHLDGEGIKHILKSHSTPASFLRVPSHKGGLEGVSWPPTHAGLFYDLESLLSQFVQTGKTYLDPIKGYASLIQDDNDPGDINKYNNTKRWADKIMRNVTQMERYFQLLSIFGITGALGGAKTSWRLVIGGVLDIYTARNEKRVTIEVTNNVRGHVRQHGELLKRVLVHLLNNAYESTTHGDRISLAVSNAVVDADTGGKPNTIVEISDTGCGIEAKNAELIWEPFFTTKHDHIGLGLPFVAVASPVLGMDVKLESAAGHGTKITLVLTEQGGKIETQTLDR